MQLAFKESTRASVPQILNLMQQFNATYGYLHDARARGKLVTDFVDNPQLGRLWLIEVDGATAGYVVLAFGFSFEYLGRDAFIDELFIGESFRNRGVGGRTLDYIALQARELQIKTLHLEVERSNENARHLYSQKGYTENGRMLLSRAV